MAPEDFLLFFLSLYVLIRGISAIVCASSLGTVRRSVPVNIPRLGVFGRIWLSASVSKIVCMQGAANIRSFNATPVCQYDAELECRGDCQALMVSWLGTYHMEALLEKHKLGASDSKSWRDNENIR